MCAQHSHSASGNDTCNWCTARAPERSSGCTRVMVHHCTKPKTRQNSIAPHLFFTCRFLPLARGPGSRHTPSACSTAAPRLASCVFVLFWRQKNNKPAFLPIFWLHFVYKKMKGTRGTSPRRGPGTRRLPGPALRRRGAAWPMYLFCRSDGVKLLIETWKVSAFK